MTDAHELIRAELESYALGELEGSTRSSVERHVDSCEECRGWLDTYRLVAASMAAEDTGQGHPESERLAEAAASNSAPIEDRELQDHLDSCGSCREQVELTRAALAEADIGSLRSSHSYQRAAIWAAAAVLLVALGIGFVADRGPEVAGFQAERQISDLSLSGVQDVEAVASLSASTVHVEPGATVRFRAGETVALADGFSVGSGANFAVELVGSDQGREKAVEDRN